MPQAHVGVEIGDSKPATVQWGPHECVGDIVGHPQGARADLVQRPLDLAQPLWVGGHRLVYVAPTPRLKRGLLPLDLGRVPEGHEGQEVEEVGCWVTDLGMGDR